MSYLDDRIKKPERWGFDETELAPEWEGFWNGCFFNLPFWEKAGTPKDVSSNGQIVTNNGAIWTYTRSGPAMRFNGSSDYINAGAMNQHAVSNELTIWVRFRADANDSMVYMRFNGSSGGDLQLYITTTPSIRASMASSILTGPYTLGKTVDVHFIFGEANDDYRIYLNGVEVDSLASTRTLGSNAEPWLIGTDADATGAGSLGNYFGGDIECIAMWDRVLPAAVISQHASNPFGPLRRESKVLYFLPLVIAAANPKGPLGMPFHGPFGGPI